MHTATVEKWDSEKKIWLLHAVLVETGSEEECERACYEHQAKMDIAMPPDHNVSLDGQWLYSVEEKENQPRTRTMAKKTGESQPSLLSLEAIRARYKKLRKEEKECAEALPFVKSDEYRRLAARRAFLSGGMSVISDIVGHELTSSWNDEIQLGDKFQGTGWSAEVVELGRAYGAEGRPVTLAVTWASGKRQNILTSVRRLNSGVTQKNLDEGGEKTSE